jgi:hypothetical protein
MASEQAFEFQDLKIYNNGNIERDDIRFFYKYDSEYEVDDSYPGNRTILCYTDGSKGALVQMVYHVSVFDIILPCNKNDFFKKYMFEQVLDYIVYMIQFTFSDFNISNEAEFKVNFYAENDSPASLFKWWEISGENIPNRYGWKSEIVTHTALGKPLSEEYKRLKMRLRFNSSYKLESSTFDYVSDEKSKKVYQKPKNVYQKPKKNVGYGTELVVAVEPSIPKYIPNAIECSSYCNPEDNNPNQSSSNGGGGRGVSKRGRGGNRGRYQKPKKESL